MAVVVASSLPRASSFNTFIAYRRRRRHSRPNRCRNRCCQGPAASTFSCKQNGNQQQQQHTILFNNNSNNNNLTTKAGKDRKTEKAGKAGNGREGRPPRQRDFRFCCWNATNIGWKSVNVFSLSLSFTLSLSLCLTPPKEKGHTPGRNPVGAQAEGEAFGEGVGGWARLTGHWHRGPIGGTAPEAGRGARLKNNRAGGSSRLSCLSLRALGMCSSCLIAAAAFQFLKNIV